MDEITRYQIDDQVYIVLCDGDQYILDAEWSDGPAAIFDHVPTEEEVAVVHRDYLEALRLQDEMGKIEDEVDAIEQARFEAQLAAEVEAQMADEARRSELRPLSAFAHLAKPDTLRRAALEGRLQAEKIGRDWLTDEDAVRAFLRSRGKRQRKQKPVLIDLLPGLRLNVYPTHVVYHLMPRAWDGRESIEVLFDERRVFERLLRLDATRAVEVEAAKYGCTWPVTDAMCVLDNEDVQVWRVVLTDPGDDTQGAGQHIYFYVLERAASRSNGRVKVSPHWV